MSKDDHPINLEMATLHSKNITIPWHKVHVIRRLKLETNDKSRICIRTLVNPTRQAPSNLENGYHQLDLVMAKGGATQFVRACKRALLLDASDTLNRFGSRWKFYEPSMVALVAVAQDDLKYVMCLVI